MTLRYIGRRATLLLSSRNANRSIATFNFQLLIVRLRLPVVVLLLFYAGCWMRVMLNTHLNEVKIDWETGPPLDRTRKVIHPSFSWRSNRELVFKIIKEDLKLGISFFIIQAPSLLSFELRLKPKIYKKGEQFVISFYNRRRQD